MQSTSTMILFCRDVTTPQRVAINGANVWGIRDGVLSIESPAFYRWATAPPRREIWEEEEIPVDWKTRLIVKLPKKGNLSLRKNWRGITLMSITSKIFSRVILNRISTALDPMLRKEQAGFRKGRSCGEHIFTLRQILEQCQEWKTLCYLCKLHRLWKGFW